MADKSRPNRHNSSDSREDDMNDAVIKVPSATKSASASNRQGDVIDLSGQFNNSDNPTSGKPGGALGALMSIGHVERSGEKSFVVVGTCLDV